MIDPIANATAWHTITIGTSVSPGVCELAGWDRPFDWDEKKGKGTSGGSLTFTNRPLGGGTVTFTLWLASHFDEWQSFRKLLDYDTTKRPAQAVDIYHPAIAANGFRAVVVAKIGPLTHRGKGRYTVAVEFREYAPPPKKSAVSTPTGSGNGPREGPRALEGDQPPAIADARQAQIEALLAEARKP